jgi:hypothetical protein
MQTLPQPREVSAEVFRALLEERTRRYFDMSLDEFIEAFRAGRLDDSPTALDIALLIGARPGEDQE